MARCPQRAGQAARVLGPGHCAIPRAIFFHTDGCATAEPTLRPVPPEAGGQGLHVQGIQPDSVYRKCGFADGDIWLKINQFALSSPEQMLTSYRTLVQASTLSFSLMRAGRPVTIRVDLE
jgi:S1-C subfamily serine protease